MKIAILVSGFLRTFWANYQNMLENLIEPNDADVFIYTGSDRSLDRPKGSRCSSDTTRDGIPLEFDEEGFFGRKLKGHLKVFRVIEDEFESYVSEYRTILPLCPYCRRGLTDHLECRNPPVSAVQAIKWHTIDSHLRLRRCNELRRQYEVETKVRYDAVVRIRGDIRLSFRLDLARYSFAGADLYSEGAHGPGQRECFFFGSSAVMDTVCREYVYEYGRLVVEENNNADLKEFRSFLEQRGIRRRLFNSEAMHFLEDAAYRRSSCSRTGRGCTCCLTWKDVPVSPEEEVPGTEDVQHIRVLLL